MKSTDLLLFEFNASRSVFKQILQDTTIKMGFEAEMVTPYEETRRTEFDPDDYSWNSLQSSDIHIPQRMINRVEDRYENWRHDQADEELDSMWRNDGRDYTIRWLVDHNKIDSEDDDDLEERIGEWNAVARRDFDDEERDNALDSVGSIDDFIEDEWGSMSRMLDDFGVEYSEEEEIEPEDVYREMADDLKRIVGKPVEVFNDYHQDEKNYSRWYIEPDSSIAGEGNIGAEVVSSVYTLADGLEAMEELFDWMRENYYSTNSSTGLHVSFSIEGMADENYDILKMMVLFDENYTAKLFDRLNAGYAKQLRSVLFGKFESTPNPLEAMSSRQISETITALRRITKNFTFEGYAFGEAKYFSFNHRGDGVFEFRSMGNGGYERRFDIIRKRIINMAYLMKIGSDPNLMAREYLGRVYRMLTSGKFQDDNLGSGAAGRNAPPMMLSAFKSFFVRDPGLLRLADSAPIYFIARLLRNFRGQQVTLSPLAARQLRFYVARHKLTPAEVRQEIGDDDVYDRFAAVMRWPLVVPGEHDERQGALGFVQPSVKGMRPARPPVADEQQTSRSRFQDELNLPPGRFNRYSLHTAGSRRWGPRFSD
jgi:hypothetical protein